MSTHTYDVTVSKAIDVEIPDGMDPTSDAALALAREAYERLLFGGDVESVDYVD